MSAKKSHAPKIRRRINFGHCGASFPLVAISTIVHDDKFRIVVLSLDLFVIEIRYFVGGYHLATKCVPEKDIGKKKVFKFHFSM